MTEYCKPNFFIVGAPKCATTAMNQYLSCHPKIFMGFKESHYFASDIYYTKSPKIVFKDYQKIFSGWEGEALVGEASVFYIYSTEAALKIKEFNPNSKIIIMLRNPIDRAYSDYFEQVYNGREILNSFEDAINLESLRVSGNAIPKKAKVPRALLYTRNGLYEKYIRNYFNVFGRENVHIIIYDNFKNNTKNEYDKTLRFLGISDKFYPSFEIINPHKAVFSRALYDFIRHPPEIIGKIAKKMVPSYELRQMTRRILIRLNTIYNIERKPMKKETVTKLNNEYSIEIERLSKLLNYDLMHWCEGN